MQQESLLSLGDGEKVSKGPAGRRKRRARPIRKQVSAEAKVFRFPCGETVERITRRSSLQMHRPAGPKCDTCDHKDAVSVGHGILCIGEVV